MTQLTPKFNYSQLDQRTQLVLRNKEAAMSQIVGKAYTDLGKELKEAQDTLSSHGYGCFEEWYTSLGFKKQSVYNYINRYELIVQQLDKRDVIEELPLNLAYEISKKTTDPELTQKVLDGEIKSLQELQDLKKQLKEQQEIVESLKSDAAHWQKVAKSAQNIPPKVVTNTVSVIPDHIKKELEEKDFQLRNLRTGYQEAKEKLEAYEMRSVDDFDAEEARRQREKLQHEADINTINLRVHFKQFVEKASITTFLHAAIASASDSEKERLAELAEAAEKIIDQTKLALRGRRLGVVNE